MRIAPDNCRYGIDNILEWHHNANIRGYFRIIARRSDREDRRPMSAIPLAGGYETFGRSIRWMLDGSATAYARGFRTLLTRNETTRIRGRKARRIERRQIDRPRRAVDDQLG